jgi:hypothetical protein
MKNIPENILKKIEMLKSLILAKSGLLSEYGSNVSIITGDVVYDREKNKVNELIFEIKINDVDCPECDFEPENISQEIVKLKTKIYKGSVVGLTENLQLKNTYSSLRGVLLYTCDLYGDNFEKLEFGVFFDPGFKY